MDIDWSKAPEGATHYREDWHCTSTGGVQYYKKSEGGWEYWGELLGHAWRECGEPVLGFKEISNKMKKQPIWTGEGLPPVGSHVHVYDPDGNLSYGAGEDGEVVAHVENTAVIRMSYGLGCFTAKHLRTAEQIVADQREKAIDEMVRTALHQSYVITPAQAKIVVQRLYDANYRKQVTP